MPTIADALPLSTHLAALLAALAGGVLVKPFKLPPLAGYLAAGFILYLLGFRSTTGIEQLAELGITLMLFTIGLKLDLRSLASREILLPSLAATLVWSVVVTVKLLLGVAWLGGWLAPLTLTVEQALLIAFALSFSSTVCIIKLLQEHDELKTRHGRIAIGVLIIQDLLAVAFLVAALGKYPSPWALALPLLWFARPLLDRLLRYGGHGELLPLAGLALALSAAWLFELVDVKGDLGALLLGALLAGRDKSAELYKSLNQFKDLFLVGFFLSIGLTALPDWQSLWLALAITLLLLFKGVLFFALLVALKVAVRSAFLAALALTNFSEFGLIVAQMGYQQGWLESRWLVTLALAVTLSFVVSSLLSQHAHSLYSRWRGALYRFAPGQQLQHQPISVEGAEVLVVGLGRVGRAAYDRLVQSYPGRVCGIDVDEQRQAEHLKAGRRVLLGDGEDIDFWSKLELNTVSLIMLSVPNVSEMQFMIEQMRGSGFGGRIVCIARYEDERQLLLKVGADAVFSYFSEVGVGFADEGQRLLAGTR